MAFTFIEKKDVTYSNFWASLMNDLNSIDGWDIYDDKVGSSRFFVMKVTTSEGVGNELFIRFFWNSLTDENVRIEMGEAWNIGTATFTNKIAAQYNHLGPGVMSGSELIDYRITGDNDHAIITFIRKSSTYLGTPIYLGLIDKTDKVNDINTRAAVMMAYYYLEGHSTTTNALYYDDQNRVPVLRSWAGVHNGWGRMTKETPMLRGRSTDELLRFGPWGPGKRIFSSPIGIWENAWGLRGYLKNVRVVSSAPQSTLQRWETVLINGDEYYWWVCTDYNSTISYRSTWNMYQSDGTGTGGHRHGWLIRKTANN